MPELLLSHVLFVDRCGDIIAGMKLWIPSVSCRAARQSNKDSRLACEKRIHWRDIRSRAHSTKTRLLGDSLLHGFRHPWGRPHLRKDQGLAGFQHALEVRQDRRPAGLSTFEDRGRHIPRVTFRHCQAHGFAANLDVM